MSVDSAGLAARLGIKPGMVVQELGWDEDADEDLRDSIVDISGGEMVDEDTDEVADVVILWWREDDGDLVDALVDAIGALAEDGVVWLLVPKSGRPGHVEPEGPVARPHERSERQRTELGSLRLEPRGDRKLQRRRSGCSSHYRTRPLRTAHGRQRNSFRLQDGHHAGGV